MLRTMAAAAVLALPLVSCSESDAPKPSSPSIQEASSSSTAMTDEQKEALYVKKVRANIPGAAAYDNGAIVNMGKNVCALGSVDMGVQVLDNYSQIEAEDRAELASIALKYAC